MPSREFHFWVYILASRSRTLYIGETNNLFRRVVQHRRGESVFTARYSIHRLVHFEHFRYISSAITRENELKRMTRAQKLELIEAANPTWEDLFTELARGRNYPLD